MHEPTDEERPDREDREDRLRRRVHHLAGEIGERNVYRPGSLETTARWLEEAWTGQGYPVRRHPYRTQTGGESHRVVNLDVERPGRVDETILVGAHYDSVSGCPGANDNGSAVAVLLELSRAFAGIRPRRTVRFVAFVNEEPPFLLEGSGHYARQCKARGEPIRGMIALETLGFYSGRDDLQRYPPLLGWLYPRTADFVAFVANPSSFGWFRRCLGAFRGATDFPSRGAVLPSLVPGVGWSDHASFWSRGYDALMITDTAFYRYRHYHEPTDTPDRLNYPALAQLTDGLEGMLRELAG